MTPSEQIDRLAQFIMNEVPGEPSQSEGAVDCAIRVIRELADKVEGYEWRLHKVVEACDTYIGTPDGES